VQAIQILSALLRLVVNKNDETKPFTVIKRNAEGRYRLDYVPTSSTPVVDLKTPEGTNSGSLIVTGVKSAERYNAEQKQISQLLKFHYPSALDWVELPFELLAGTSIFSRHTVYLRQGTVYLNTQDRETVIVPLYRHWLKLLTAENNNDPLPAKKQQEPNRIAGFNPFCARKTTTAKTDPRLDKLARSWDKQSKLMSTPLKYQLPSGYEFKDIEEMPLPGCIRSMFRQYPGNLTQFLMICLLVFLLCNKQITKLV
jgi:hypothetical protein